MVWVVDEFVPYQTVAVLIFFAATVAIFGAVAYNYEGHSEFDFIKLRNRLLENRYSNFWRSLPKRLWRLFIPAFFVPSYREEWGRYKAWNCRAQFRSHAEKDVLHRKKKRAHARHQKATSAKSHKTELEKRLELEREHDHSLCQKVKINVNGHIFETQKRTLNRFPDTLLGNPLRRMKFYDPIKNEYYFDRSRLCFEWILYYYQSGGRLCRPDNIQNDVFYQEIKFYQLGKASIQRYEKDEGWTKNTTLMDLPANLLLRKLWLLFDIPESSRQATTLALLSVFVVLTSIVVFCIETLDAFKPQFKNSKSNNSPEMDDRDCLDFTDPFFFLETSCSAWFLLELLVRFISCPGKLKFVKNFVNIVDIIAVLPYILNIVVYAADPNSCHNTKSNSATSSLSVIRIVRLVRVFRILKLSRHNKGLKILGLTLSSSFSELLLLIFFVGVGTILFSSTMYYAEQTFGTDSGHGQFESIPAGFWWALQTLTTVGYGDQVPRSFVGKIIGAFCAIAGVLTLSLPVPVIVSNFNNYYRQEIDEMEQRSIPYTHTDMCPYLPGGFGYGVKPKVMSNPAGKFAKSSTELYKGYNEADSDTDFEDLKLEKIIRKHV